MAGAPAAAELGVVVATDAGAGVAGSADVDGAGAFVGGGSGGGDGGVWLGGGPSLALAEVGAPAWDAGGADVGGGRLWVSTLGTGAAIGADCDASGAGLAAGAGVTAAAGAGAAIGYFGCGALNAPDPGVWLALIGYWGLAQPVSAPVMIAAAAALRQRLVIGPSSRTSREKSRFGLKHLLSLSTRATHPV